MDNNDLYEPREDSFLLAKQVATHARGFVLDVGTGSGIQAVTAAKRKTVRSVLAVDINKKVLLCAKKQNPHKKIRYHYSDLFSTVSGTFDTIICNPPYLPDEPRLKDIALDGGKRGHEYIARFLSQAGFYLNKNGIILLVFSSFTNKHIVDQLVKKNGFVATLLSSYAFDFETLYVYKIVYPPAVQRFYSHGIHRLTLFARGHRGLVFSGFLKKKKVAIKMQRPDIAAHGTVAREANVLRILNRHGIGPRLIVAGKDYFMYEFVDGLFFLPFIRQASGPVVKSVLVALFYQMKKLDELGMTKEEMHHPFKHILIPKIISTNKPAAVLLDFERCKKTSKPHNVTQFSECIARCVPELAAAGIHLDAAQLRAAAAAYRRNPHFFATLISLIKKA